MRKLLLLLSFVIGIMCVSESSAQTKIQFAKGTSSKTITVTIPANGEKSFAVQVKKNQAINVSVSGDINISKTNEFPVIAVNLVNGEEEIDSAQDGEGYLSVWTGRNGNYIFNLSNSSKRVRIFKMLVAVTNDRADFLGGEDVEH